MVGGKHCYWCMLAGKQLMACMYSSEAGTGNQSCWRNAPTARLVENMGERADAVDLWVLRVYWWWSSSAGLTET